MQQQDRAVFFEILMWLFCPSLASIFPLLDLDVTYKCRDCNAERLMEPDRIQLVDVRIPDGPGDTQFKVEDLLPFPEWVAIDQGNHVSDLCDGNVHPLDPNFSPSINQSDTESRPHDEGKGVHEISTRLEIQGDYDDQGKTKTVLKSVRHYSDNDTIPNTESENEALSQMTVRDRTPPVLNSEQARVAPPQPRHYSDDETIPETASEQETQSPGIQSDGPTRARIPPAFNSNLAQAMREHKSASSTSMPLSGNRPHHRCPDANSQAMK
jgi:hypothetical protein